jgi:hypothetical protein
MKWQGFKIKSEETCLIRSVIDDFMGQLNALQILTKPLIFVQMIAYPYLFR